MARGYEFDGVNMKPVLANVDPMAQPELTQQPTAPVPLNPNYRRRFTPSTIIIERTMQDRSSFIGHLVERQSEPGEQS